MSLLNNAVFKSEVFEYNNTSITFELENGDVMVNATHMSKAFGKFPADFIRLEQTQRFCEALSKKLTMGIPIIKSEAGKYGGTWMHRKLALKFAGWLDADFEVWVYDRIEELMEKGVVHLNVPKTMAEALRLAADQAELIEKQNEQLQLQQPKVIFADAVSASKTSILVGDLAKILKQNGVNTGATRFFDWLRNNGYLIKRKGSDFNMPTQRSMEMGLFEIKETAITHSDGHVTVSKTPKVTGKGQEYFINKFLGGIAA